MPFTIHVFENSNVSQIGQSSLFIKEIYACVVPQHATNYTRK